MCWARVRPVSTRNVKGRAEEDQAPLDPIYEYGNRGTFLGADHHTATRRLDQLLFRHDEHRGRRDAGRPIEIAALRYRVDV
jgi:hypothetical protein